MTAADEQPMDAPKLAEIAVLIGIACIGLALRLVDLQHESIWYDEAFSLRISKTGVVPLFNGSVADPGNPTAYYVLLVGWQKLFGSTIEAARAFSGVAGALTVPAVWLLTRAVGLTKSIRLTSCWLAAVSPPLVYLGREARCYALFITVTTLLAAAAERCARRGRWFDWLSFALLGAISVHTHYYGFLVLVALGMRLLAACFDSAGFDKQKFSALLGAAIAVAATFAPYWPVFRWQLSLGSSRSGETWWQHLALFPLYSICGRTLIWKEQGQKWVAAADVFCCLVIFLPLLPATMRLRRQLATPLAASVGLLAVAVVVSVGVTPMIHSHYLSCALPPLLVAVAAALAATSSTNRLLAKSIGIVLMALTAVSLGGLFGRLHKTDWRGVAEFVGASAADRPVYFFEDIGADPYRYYRPDDDCRLIVENFGVDGQGWRKAGWIGRMQSDVGKQGFVLIYYATNAVNRDALSRCRLLLEKEFQRVEQRAFGPIGPIHVFVVGP